MARKVSPVRIVASEGEPRPLSRTTGAPLHHQIFLVLRDQIQSGRYSGGASLPSEEELAKLFGVSRITVRTALKNLDAHGLIDRRQGVGTFVRDHITQTPIHVAIRDQRAYIEESVRRTKIKLLEFEYAPAPPDVRRWFNCGPDDLFLRIVRLRYAARPTLLLTTYMPEEIGKLFKHEDYGREAHYELLAQAGIQVASGEQVVSAMLADPVIAARLEIEVGSPLLRIFHFDLDQNERPIRLLEVLAHPSENEIHMKIDGAPRGD